MNERSFITIKKEKDLKGDDTKSRLLRMPGSSRLLRAALLLSGCQGFYFYAAGPAQRRSLRRPRVVRRMSTLAKEEGGVSVPPPPEGGEGTPTPPPDGEQTTRISVLRQGATTVGPSSRPVTIFPGDYVVHRDLGIARFIDCVVDERWPMISCLRLNFGNNAEFVVNPADRDKVSRLKSSDAAKPPKLTPLTEKGLAMWAARVKRVEESTKVIAQDILALYAARNEFVREPCAPDNDDFAAFEGMFEFEPTVDQKQCFDDVAHDMIGRQTPMDRLVCGDVGFGKTEIAMRAIFRAVQNKRQ